MIRVPIAALVSAVLLMLWGFVLWEVTPIMTAQFKTMNNEGEVKKTLQAELPQSGTYVLPWYDTELYKSDPEKAREELNKKHLEGPVAQIIIRKQGTDAMHWTVFVESGMHYILSSLLVGILLWMAAPSLEAYLARVAFVFIAALFAVVMVHPENPIWFHQPWGYPLTRMWTTAVGWIPVAFVMGAIVRRKQ